MILEFEKQIRIQLDFDQCQKAFSQTTRNQSNRIRQIGMVKTFQMRGYLPVGPLEQTTSSSNRLEISWELSGEMR